MFSEGYLLIYGNALSSTIRSLGFKLQCCGWHKHFQTVLWRLSTWPWIKSCHDTESILPHFFVSEALSSSSTTASHDTPPAAAPSCFICTAPSLQLFIEKRRGFLSLSVCCHGNVCEKPVVVICVCLPIHDLVVIIVIGLCPGIIQKLEWWVFHLMCLCPCDALDRTTTHTLRICEICCSQC